MNRPVVVLAFAAAIVATSGASAGSSSMELVRIARAHEAAHEEDVAIRRYSEALALDPTCGEAYLGLGALRARRGDVREAERVFSVALEHVPELRPALAGRGRARWALGRRVEAERDLEAFAADDDPEALRELAAWYAEQGQLPAQLSIWRRLAARAAQSGDPALAKEARTMVRALQIVIGPCDPAASPGDLDPTRRGIAAIAKRGG